MKIDIYEVKKWIARLKKECLTPKILCLTLEKWGFLCYTLY